MYLRAYNGIARIRIILRNKCVDGSMAHEDQAWKLDREPDQVSKDGGAAPPTEALITEPAKLPDPQQSTLFSAGYKLF